MAPELLEKRSAYWGDYTGNITLPFDWSTLERAGQQQKRPETHYSEIFMTDTEFKVVVRDEQRSTAGTRKPIILIDEEIDEMDYFYSPVYKTPLFSNRQEVEIEIDFSKAEQWKTKINFDDFLDCLDDDL